MLITKINPKNYKPNIRFLKDYIIIFNNINLILYDLKGNLLDYLLINICNICIVNDKFLIVIHDDGVRAIIITNNKLKNNGFIEIKTKKDTEFFPILKIFDTEGFFSRFDFSEDLYIDSFYSKKNNLLFTSYKEEIKIIKIDPINSLIEKEIQTIYNTNNIFIRNINNQKYYLLNLDKNLLVAYGENSIFLYQKINNIKTYQLKSKLTFNYYLDPFKNALKLDNKTIIIINNYIFYIINITKMKIIQKYVYNNKTINFIYKLDNIIFVCTDYYTHIFKYFNNKLNLMNSINLTDTFIWTYLTSSYLKKCCPKLEIRIFISKYYFNNLNLTSQIFVTTKKPLKIITLNYIIQSRSKMK